MDVPLEIYLHIAVFSDVGTILNMLSIISASENEYRYIVRKKYPATMVYYDQCESWETIFRNILSSQQKLDMMGFPQFNLPSFDPIRISQSSSDFSLWKYGILHSIEINNSELMIYCAQRMDYPLEPWILLQWSVRANNILIVEYLLKTYSFGPSDLRYVMMDAQGEIKEILTALRDI